MEHGDFEDLYQNHCRYIHGIVAGMIVPPLPGPMAAGQYLILQPPLGQGTVLTRIPASLLEEFVARDQ